MFSINQIISANKAKRLVREQPQALLITCKDKPPVVLVDGALFEELMEFRYAAESSRRAIERNQFQIE